MTVHDSRGRHFFDRGEWVTNIQGERASFLEVAGMARLALDNQLGALTALREAKMAGFAQSTMAMIAELAWLGLEVEYLEYLRHTHQEATELFGEWAANKMLIDAGSAKGCEQLFMLDHGAGELIDALTNQLSDELGQYGLTLLNPALSYAVYLQKGGSDLVD